MAPGPTPAESRPAAWLASQLPKENLGDFDYPWCWKLINSPLVTEVPFESRTITRNSSMHALFNRTLATNDTIRACQAFHLDNHDQKRTDAILLASIGSGMDGHAGLAHGGTIATLFDEALSVAALMTTKKDESFMTATQSISYKAPVKTPGVLLIRSWAEKIQGRKMYIKGTMEDGSGNVYATAETLYIVIKAKM